MNEESIFNQALDIDDAPSRTAFLDQACGDHAGLRERVNSLLEEHERCGEFLGIPALEQMRAAEVVTNPLIHDTTRPGKQLEEQVEFSFLQPSSVPGSLGCLAHYDIQEMIGRGGFGTVFKAFDQRLHRFVAIKVLMPDMATTSPASKRFLREARATAAIRHENVVSIYAVEETPIPFLVMEFIDGKTLQQRIDETGPLDLQTILRVGRKIAEGLESAHQKGLIHRDLTPGNILIESGTGQVKVVDFGLVGAADDSSESQSLVIAGTPLYMSPEQALGHPLDCRSDLFSLGSLLYLMCTGRSPFHAPSPLAVLKRVVDEEPRNIQEIIPEIPSWLAAIIRKLLAKDPTKRYASAQEVADILAPPPISSSSTKRPHLFVGIAVLMKFLSEKRQHKSNWFRLMLVSLVGFVILLLASTVWISMDQGTLVISSTAETQIEIRYQDGTTQQKQLSHGRTSIRISPGEVFITLAEGNSKDLVVQNPRIVIHRGGTATVTIEQFSKQNVHDPENPESISKAEPKTVQSGWQTKAAAEANLPKQFTNTLGMQFQIIPAAHHCPGASALDGPVTSSFYMASREVSVAEFVQVMEEFPKAYPGKGVEPTLPAQGVSWQEAIEFCRRLSDLPEERSRWNQYTLPSLAEWEWACRAGNPEEIPWTPETVHEHVVFHEPGPLAVGSFSPNPFGLFDLHGNVAEWVADWIPEPVNGQQSISPYKLSVACGGSYESNRLEQISPSARTFHHSDEVAKPDQGFRIICRIQKPFRPEDRLSDQPEEDFDQMITQDLPQRGWGFPGGEVIHRDGELIQSVGGGSEWGTIWYGGHGNLNDFDLRFDFKIESPGVESQLFFHADVLEKGWPQGSSYRLYLSGPLAGLLYQAEPRSTGVVEAMPADVLVQTRFDTWNELVVRCEGRRTRIWLNSQLAIDFSDPVAGICLRGPLSFLTTGSPDAPRRTARFRNLRIKLLGNPSEEDRKHIPWSMGMETNQVPDSESNAGFVPLFNDENLEGWLSKRSATIDWSNENGTITGRNRSALVNSAGHLQSVKQYRDFHFRCEVLSGSGTEPFLLFRNTDILIPGQRRGYALIEPLPGSSVIAEGWGYGSLYADDFQVLPEKSRLVPSSKRDLGLRIGEWYRVEFIAYKQNIEVRINGITTAVYTSNDPRLNRAGNLSIRCGAGKSVTLRDLQVKELSTIEVD